MFPHKDITDDLSRAKKFFENIVSYTIGPFSVDKVISKKIDTINIVDVREYEDYIDGHIPFAIHIPYKKIEEHIKMLNQERTTIVYSYSDSCPRAYKTALALVEKHFSAMILRGGYREWKKFDLDIIKNDSNDYKEASPE